MNIRALLSLRRARAEKRKAKSIALGLRGPRKRKKSSSLSKLKKALWREISRRERIIVHSGPDSVGRWAYTMEWLAGYHPGDPRGENRTAWRGQLFHAPLPEWFRQEARRAGKGGERGA